jgi:hypothetical protein
MIDLLLLNDWNCLELWAIVGNMEAPRPAGF